MAAKTAVKICAKCPRKARQPSTLRTRKTAASKQKRKSSRSPRPETQTSSAPGIANKNHIISTGETFADGAMIELVSGSSGLNKPALLLWTGNQGRLAPASNTAAVFTRHRNCLRVYAGQ